MYPPMWGPQVWDTLHILAYVYPDQPTLSRQQSTIQLLTELCRNLPCPGCSNHALEYLDTVPATVSTRVVFKQWVYDFHNAVNLRTNKRIWTSLEAETRLETLYFKTAAVTEMVHAQSARVEDHRVITDLQTALRDSTTTITTTPTTTITLCLLLVSLTISLLVVGGMLIRVSHLRTKHEI